MGEKNTAPLRVVEVGAFDADGIEVHRVVLEGSKDAVKAAARLLYEQVRVVEVQNG